MSHKKPKTTGLEWLTHSLVAFNGTGYADMKSPEDYLESYIAYKSLRKKDDAVLLARRHQEDVKPMLEKLLATTLGASKVPPEKYLQRVQAQRKSMQDQVKLL